jgi:hypothetical protein
MLPGIVVIQDSPFGIALVSRLGTGRTGLRARRLYATRPDHFDKRLMLAGYIGIIDIKRCRKALIL